MHPGSRPGKTRKRVNAPLPVWHYWVYWAGVLCALVAALCAFGLIHWPARNNKGRASSGIADGASQLRQSGYQPGIALPQRRLYPYSVIPGGVYNAQELRNAVAHDPLVAMLYANFDVSKARVVRLMRDREVYVSYRFGGHIYWTKKRLLLRAGETVITDGQHEARTRCGNRISETPMQPVRQDEPPDAAVNGPPSFPLLADNSEPPPLLALDPPVLDPVAPGMTMLPPPGSPPVSVIPPPYFPIVGGGPSSFPNITPPPPPPPVATPEPSALSLLVLGLLLLATVAGASTLGKDRKTESREL
ncbi:MAG: hypothetical protein WBQ34_13935 [Candidatus Acidiferrales bacterium]